MYDVRQLLTGWLGFSPSETQFIAYAHSLSVTDEHAGMEIQYSVGFP